MVALGSDVGLVSFRPLFKLEEGLREPRLLFYLNLIQIVLYLLTLKSVQIWVVLLICHSTKEICLNQSEALPKSGLVLLISHVVRQICFNQSEALPRFG